jgi:hypothetical protein
MLEGLDMSSRVRKRFVSASLAAGLLAGCTSFTSTLIEPGHDPTAHHNKEKTHLRGYPITLHVPTHLRVELIEEFYLREVQNEQPTPITCNGKLLCTYDIATEVIESDKIFTVDYKRPAAGMIKYDTKFTSDQYIYQIRSQLVDNTIAQVANAVQRALYNFGAGTTLPAGQVLTGTAAYLPPKADPIGTGPAGPPREQKHPLEPYKKKFGKTEVPPDAKKYTRVIATQVFSIDEPDVADQVTEFVSAQVRCR